MMHFVSRFGFFVAALLTVGSCLPASSEPLSASLSVEAVRVLNSRAILSLRITHKFDTTPTTPCTIRLYGMLSYVDKTPIVPAGRFRMASKASLKRTVRFSFRGAPVRQTKGRRTQLNLQTASTCEGSPQTIFSEPAAANVTCNSGLTISQFLAEVKKGTQSVTNFRLLKRSGSCD